MRHPTFLLQWVLLLSCLLLSAGSPLLAQEWEEAFESYVRYIGNHPHDDESAITERINGVANSADAWYFTQEYSDLWKVPVWVDLDDIPTAAGVVYFNVDTDPNYRQYGYNHFGDLDYHRNFLLIPLEGADPLANGMLEWIGRAPLAKLNGQWDGSWCAVHPKTEHLYINRTWDDLKWLARYSISWDKLKQNPPVIEMIYLDDVRLRDENGKELTIQHVQGGDFSESGRLLFLVSGGTSTDESDCKIHVFDTTNWRRVAYSFQDSGALFRYECHSGCSWCDESQGITVWDLDDGRAPKIRGQLHVIQVDPDIDTDDLYFHHYTGSIFVDGANSGAEDGTAWLPYNTFAEALGLAWNGATIVIRPGTVAEPNSITVNKIVQLRSVGGRAVVGPGGRVSLQGNGKVKVLSQGELKLHQ
jgi:hypothetical protein